MPRLSSPPATARSLVLAGLVTTGLASCSTPNADSSDPAAAATSTPAAPAAWETQESAQLSLEQFNTVTFPSSELEQHLPPGSDEQHIPAALQGLWWMDGNPLAPGNVLSFAKAQWDLPNHRFLMQEYGPQTYTYNGDDSGHASFASAVNDNLCFEVQMSADYTTGQLIQTNRIPGTAVRIKIPKELVNYQMQQISDGDYLRASWWGPQRVPDYHLRRIIDAKGQHIEPAYSNWRKVAPELSIMVDSMKTP